MHNVPANTRLRQITDALRTEFAAEQPDDAVADLRKRFVEAALVRLAGQPWTPACSPQELAREIADTGVGLPEALNDVRAAAHTVWDRARTAARSYGTDTYQALLERASDLWCEFESWSSAVHESYQQTLEARTLLADREREVFVEALLTGAGGDPAMLRRSADALELPKIGMFCVIAVEHTGLPGHTDIERRFGAEGIRSAWSLTALEEVGVVYLGAPPGAPAARESAATATLLKSLLTANNPSRAGMSTFYDKLGFTPVASRLAHLALASLPAGSMEVCQYGDRPLETLLAAAPESSRDLCLTVLGDLLRLPNDGAELLLATVAAWCASGGSISQTAERLYCHRNTVRYRLKQVEKLTGRSLSTPQGIAEILVAVRARELHAL